jgi:FKBP-type peptidyl-prolyl cis-trans isomerase
MRFSAILLVLGLSEVAFSFAPQQLFLQPHQQLQLETSGSSTQLQSTTRRDVLSSAITASTAAILSTATLLPNIANAGIDPSALRNLPVEGDKTGTATRLRQIEMNQNRPEDSVDIPFTELPSGVSYREYREGKGAASVANGSKVAVEMTIRAKSFATTQEPGGVKIYSTKDDTDFNEVAFTVGSGEILPGLEEGMMGMHRNGLRRIEVPSTMVFAARKANQLPLPTTKNGKRIFEERLFKTEATLLFEVLVTRIK